jgi:hypothetical protein
MVASGELVGAKHVEWSSSSRSSEFKRPLVALLTLLLLELERSTTYGGEVPAASSGEAEGCRNGARPKPVATPAYLRYARLGSLRWLAMEASYGGSLLDTPSKGFVTQDAPERRWRGE